MSAHTETISEPANLQPGSTILRVAKAGEQTGGKFTVVRWERPPTPAPGQSWGSGFLHCRDAAGQRVSFGPRSLICRDFVRVVEPVRKVSQFTPARSQPRRLHWWQRDNS